MENKTNSKNKLKFLLSVSMPQGFFHLYSHLIEITYFNLRRRLSLVSSDYII